MSYDNEICPSCVMDIDGAPCTCGKQKDSDDEHVQKLKEEIEVLEEKLKRMVAKQNSSIYDICHCINWHPSVEGTSGKRAICSYCNKPRQKMSDNGQA